MANGAAPVMADRFVGPPHVLDAAGRARGSRTPRRHGAPCRLDSDPVLIPVTDWRVLGRLRYEPDPSSNGSPK